MLAGGMGAARRGLADHGFGPGGHLDCGGADAGERQGAAVGQASGPIELKGHGGGSERPSLASTGTQF
jgi:hypothetical protein